MWLSTSSTVTIARRRVMKELYDTL